MHNPEQAIFTNMCMIYDHKGNVLVQNRVKNWCGVAFPGGHLENMESIVDSVKREILEETCLIINNLSLCGVKQWFSDDIRNVCFLYKTCDYSPPQAVIDARPITASIDRDIFFRRFINYLPPQFLYAVARASTAVASPLIAETNAEPMY